MPEAIHDNTDPTAEREAWRAVKHADGPAGAAWCMVDRADIALHRIKAAARLLAHAAVCPNDLEEDELSLLSNIILEAAGEAKEAVSTAASILRPLSRAERAAAEAEAERRRNDPARMEAGALAVTKAALAELRRCRALRRQQRAEAVA